MRVSLPICIASALAVVVLTWWLSTRSRNFLEAPSAAELEQIRLSALQSNPAPQGQGNALSANRDDQQAPIPVVLPNSLKQSPRIDDYLQESKYGADYLIEFATLLESGGHPERALACWERVLDSSKADKNQTRRAAQAIVRLKAQLPPPDSDTDTPSIVIQCGTGPTAAALLEPVLQSIAETLQSASWRVMTVSTKVSSGSEDMIDDGQAPVAIWISGPDNSSPSTDVVSFQVRVEQPENLPEQVRNEIYRIIRAHLSKQDGAAALPKQSDKESTLSLLQGRVTRLAWRDFTKSLQSTP